jgi:hypothetical protein
MKAIFIILMGSALLWAGCKKDKSSIDEVPSEIIRTVANPTLYPRIVELFPEKKDVSVSFPVLFNDTVQKRIVLTDSSRVYLTFIAEEAKYRNTVGWYSYMEGHEPQKEADVNLHVLFPNASGKDEGGQLVQGDRLQVGDKAFPKGTVIGFFLVVDGWKDGEINYNAETFYTDYSLNLGAQQHHVLFREINSGDIVLGFEDLPFDDVNSDKDYNDLLFTITDNNEGFEVINFDLTKMPKL